MKTLTTRICTIFLLTVTLISSSQNISLLKNYNPKVKELNHELNQRKDSLNLKCDSKIIKVDIFNEDFDETFTVNDFKTSISLLNIPEGKFVVEVQLADKIVEMHVIKYNSDSKPSYSNSNILEGQGMMLDEQLNVIKSPPKRSIEYLLTKTKASDNKSRKKKFYWILLEVNTGNNSNKSMKLVDEYAAKKMIKRNKLVSKSNFSKSNKLYVWEIYDTTKFIKNQTANPDYINSSSSEFFNVDPYYVSPSSDDVLATL